MNIFMYLLHAEYADVYATPRPLTKYCTTIQPAAVIEFISAIGTPFFISCA